MAVAESELLQRFRTFGTPPAEFDPSTASPNELARYGLPRRR